MLTARVRCDRWREGGAQDRSRRATPMLSTSVPPPAPSPKPRAGVHYAGAVFRDGDYFGSQVNLAHRVVNRALGGEVLVTDRVAASLENNDQVELEPIGEVPLKGFPVPTPLYSVKVSD